MAPQFHGLNSQFDCIIFDLDDTLYPSETGISNATKRNIDEFLAAKCNISAERASSLRVELFRKYGSSLAGLIKFGYDVHPDEYHSYVHGRLPYDQIASDPHLVQLLSSIPQPKILFTNSDRKHVTRALARLGIQETCFDQIICFETMNPHLFEETKEIISTSSEVVLKPSPKAVEIAVGLAGFNPERMLFLDDSERNMAMGKAAGLKTALVGKRLKTKDSDYALENIHRLAKEVPEIWNMNRKVEKEIEPMRSDLDAIRSPTPVEV
ncbi:Haloacid dehalogenase-like hydrolase (HAD) superfamily protein [Rhynchospora pubera]|uniref:Haloacid dehalogenase-like hydrolase (HAD) superfamily protein n=1 Tax=Rhynchospora pubera TaxID=906938 RepID=A0AAV8FH12_9POAL|nr:Haloacid dehalogenase-like hydrolase (HAD) superfamily protein [Rhynchospora pubera]